MEGRDGVGGVEHPAKEASSDSQYHSRRVRRKGEDHKGNKDPGRENDDYETYVASLKKEHGQYQSKLQELQRRI